MKYWIPIILTVWVGCLGAVVGVFSDTFSRATNGSAWEWIFVPLQHRNPEFRDVLDLRDLSSTSTLPPTTFIFIADCSRSTHQPISTEAPWVQTSLSSLISNSYPVAKTQQAIATAKGNSAIAPLVLNTAMFTMVKAAVDLFDIEGDPQHRFAIWSVCSSVNKLFPLDDTSEELDRKFVDLALRTIDDTTYPRAERDWTKLVELFEQVVSTYELSGNSDHTRTNRQNFVITIVSDFEDSTQSPSAERNYRLRQAMDNIIAGQALVNLITVGDPSRQPGIVSYFEARSDWYKVNRVNMLEDLPSKAKGLLIPVQPADKPLRFYYNHPSYGASTAALRLTMTGPVELSLPFMTTSQQPAGRVTYGFRLLEHEDGVEQSERLGRIRGDRPSRIDNGRMNDLLDLTYEGPIPSGHQVIRITAEEERKSFLVPIIFVPRLPSDLCNLFTAFYIVPFLLAGVTVVTAVGSRFVRKRRKARPIPD